jgi:hypothetical protein
VKHRFKRGADDCQLPHFWGHLFTFLRTKSAVVLCQYYQANLGVFTFNVTNASRLALQLGLTCSQQHPLLSAGKIFNSCSY